MRPVNKGNAPNTYTNYRDAFQDLVDCIGNYCSYCERWIETHLAVEHIQPKDLNPALRNSWSNFLLGCVNCNSSKGKGQIVVKDFLWPDTDNTLLAIKYTMGGLVEVNNVLPGAIQKLANEIIKLVGLDKFPANPNPDRRPTEADKRWLRRYEVWQLAEITKQRIKNNDTVELRESIVDTALARGMFSIWWTVYDDDTDMRRRLKEAFLGTEINCFDSMENLQARPGGQT